MRDNFDFMTLKGNSPDKIYKSNVKMLIKIALSVKESNSLIQVENKPSTMRPKSDMGKMKSKGDTMP